MSDNFDRCVAVTLSYEGGNDADPHDPGGRTSRGITQREWNTYRGTRSQYRNFTDVWTAPQGAVVDIYRSEYFDPVAGAQWPIGCDLVVFDGGVNSGLGKSLVWARSALAQRTGSFVLLAALSQKELDKTLFVKRYQAARLSFLQALRTWQYFGRGWRSRVAGIEAIATRWIVAGTEPTDVAPALEKEASVSRDKRNAASGSAAAAPAAPIAHHAVVPHDSWLNYAVDVILVVGVIYLVVWLIHVYLNHDARATAFVEESKK